MKETLFLAGLAASLAVLVAIVCWQIRRARDVGAGPPVPVAPARPSAAP